METNKNPPLDKICPQHFQALQDTGPITKKIPTLAKQLQHNEEAKALEKAEGHSSNKQNRGRTTSFSVGHSIIWSEPVHSIIKTVKDKCNL